MITVLDLFSGCGGASYGMENTDGINVVEAIDLNSEAVEVYRNNFEHKIKRENIRGVFAEDLPDTDWIHGSPPCKGFSTAGKMNTGDDRNQLVLEFSRIVCNKEPEVVTMENVPDIILFDVFDKFVSELEESGYNVHYEVLQCADYGVPQTRERLYLWAVKNGSAEDLVPKPTHSTNGDIKTLTGRRLYEWRGLDSVVNTEFDRQTSQYNETRQLRKNLNIRSVSEPAYTLRGGTPSALVNYSDLPEDSITDLNSRRLNVDELKKLQTFDRDFEFDCNKTSATRLIGNSVPPRLQKHIAVEVRDLFR